LLLAAVALAALPAVADVILDDFQANTEFPGHPPQDQPSSVADSLTGRIFTTWLSQRDGTNWDVALQRFDYDLQPQGTVQYLNVREGIYNCRTPRLAISAGCVGSAWIEVRSPNRVYFRPLDAQGIPTALPVRVDDFPGTAFRDSLSIAALADGYLLVWYDLRDSSKIWAQKVDFTGALVGANFPIQPDSSGSILGLEAQTHPDGRVLVSWVADARYSRGRWLDGQGQFLGGVFEMAEVWVDEVIGKSMVRFANEGNGLMYQYSTTSHSQSTTEVKYAFRIYINNQAVQTSNPVYSGSWFGFEDYMSFGFLWTFSFPDLICLSDSSYVMVQRYDFDPETGAGEHENRIYSSLSGQTHVAYGWPAYVNLVQTTANEMLYTFQFGSAVLQQYETDLSSYSSVVYIGELNLGAPQGQAEIIAHNDGDFRLIYNNYLFTEPFLNSRYFDSAGIPSGAEVLVSMDSNLTATTTITGRMERTQDDRAVVVWSLPYDFYATDFAGSVWSGQVHRLNCGATIGPPEIAIDSLNRMSLLWKVRWQSYGEPFWNYRTKIRSCEQLFVPIGTGFNASPDLIEGSIQSFDLCVTPSGTQKWCWSGGGFGSTMMYDGIYLNQSTLLTTSNSYNLKIGYTDEGYWVFWIYSDQIFLQTLMPNGSINGEIQSINSAAARPTAGLGTAFSSSGNFAVVWQDTRMDSGDIVCRQFNPDGSFFGNEWRVNSDPPGALQTEPAVAFGPDDNLYFAWTDYRVPGGQGDIFCKVVTWEEALAAPPEVAPVPRRFALHPAHPNPFNPQTVARYEMRDARHVSLRVYDTAGRVVATLVDGWKDAGVHEVNFDGAGLASGIYLMRIEAGDFQATQKLVLLK